MYSETHRVVTNINGLVSLIFGGGTNASGKISDINWGTGSYFLKTETDPTGGGNYSIWDYNTNCVSCFDYLRS